MFDFLHTIKGPDFLLLFFFWFLVTRVAVAVARSMDHDSAGTTLFGICAFEALGVARYLVGSAHGMHKWDLLFMMMFFGGIIFLIRGEHFNSTGSGNSGWWRSSCSSSSSSCSSSSISSCSSSSSSCSGGGSSCGGCGGS